MPCTYPGKENEHSDQFKMRRLFKQAKVHD